MVSAKVPCTSSQARTQREQTMHFDGIVGEIGIGLVLAGGRDGCRPHSRSARRAGRPRRPCPAIRSRHWRRRSGSPADGRRCRAPSRPCAASSAARSGCAPPCPASTGVVQEAGVPARPSISTRHRRQEPNASSMSVAQSFGICVPASIAARMIEVPSGTVTLWPSMVSVTMRLGLGARACRNRFPGSATWRSSFIPRPAGAWAPGRNLPGNASARSSPGRA